MKTWWTTKGWPWLKGNWWVLLLLPVMLLVVVGMLVMKYSMSTGPVVIDPTAGDDAREKEEAKTRAAQLAAENAHLAQQLSDAQAKHDSQRAAFEQTLKDQVPALREDPQALATLMLQVGQGAVPGSGT